MTTEEERASLDRMLRVGAYAAVSTDDTDANKFCEADIDDLLKTNARAINERVGDV